jgi:hypothetical protein
VPKIKHFAFKQDNPSLCFRLLTEAFVFNLPDGANQKGIPVTALWDTVAELIYEEVKTLPENRAVQVLDFVKHI